MSPSLPSIGNNVSYQSFSRTKFLIQIVLPCVLTLLVFLIGCRTTSPKSSFILNRPTDELPRGLNSKMDWDRLSRDSQLEIMESEYQNFPALKFTDGINPELLVDVGEKKFSARMINYVQSNSDLQTEDDHRALIGSQVRLVRFLKLKDETILGGQVRFLQKGCVMVGTIQKFFENEEAALHAGCEIQGEHSWVISGYFNYDGTPIAVSDAFEWTMNGF